MRARSASTIALSATLLVAACSTSQLAARAPLPDAQAPKAVDVRDVGGAWRADARWKTRVAAVETAAAAALERVRVETGIEFETARGPIVEFDAAAPDEGDVALRFVDGVRRPVARVQPRALLSGEFRAPTDTAALLARSAILAGAGEREPSAWVVRGTSIVVGGAFDVALHRRALGGEAPRVAESELFGDAASDPLAAAARAKALSRCARADRPFVRFLEAVFSGKADDAALAEIGIGRREFLDAATATERSRAAAALAEDPVLPALRAARAALAGGDVGAADAALASVAAALAEGTVDPWIAADARLCLAQIARTRGEDRNAAAALGAASEGGHLVRVRDARAVETWIAVRRGDASKWAEFVRDFPDPADSARRLELLGVPADVAEKYASLVPDAASLDPGRRAAAAKAVADSGAKELAPLARLVAPASPAPPPVVAPQSKPKTK